MALLNLRRHLIFLCVILIILAIVPNVESRRSGGSRTTGKSRTTWGRSSRTIRHTPYAGGSIRKATSPFSSTAFKAALIAGTIYGSVRYMRSSHYRLHPDRIPPICRNIYDQPPNSTKVYGYFICPLEDDPDNYTWCCGTSNREICCDEHYYRRLSGGTSTGTSPFVIVGLIIAVIVVIAIAVICYKQRKNGRKLLKSLSKKSGSNGGATELTDRQLAVPLKEYEPPPGYPDQDGCPMPYDQTKSGYPPPDIQYPAQPGMYPPQSEVYPPGGPYPPPGPYPGPAGPYPPPGPYPGPAGPYPPPAEPYLQETPGIAPYPVAPGSAPYPAPASPDSAPLPYGTAPYPPGSVAGTQPPGYGQLGGYGTQHGYSSCKWCCARMNQWWSCWDFAHKNLSSI